MSTSSRPRTRHRSPNGVRRPYKDGQRWVAPLQVSTPDGGVVLVRGAGATREQALARARALETRRRAAMAVSDGDGDARTVGAWAQHWLDTIKADSLKPKTRLGYQRAIDGWIAPGIGEVPLASLTVEMLERLYAQVSAAGYSRSVWVQVRTVLKQSLDVAVRRGKVTSNVVLIAPQPGPRVLSQRYLSEDEARRVIAGCGSPAQRARWLLALSTGLRQGETLGLRWSDLDLDAELPTLRVERTLQRITGQGLITVPPKTRKSRRTLQLADPLVHALRHHRLTQRETMLALGAPWRPNGFVATSSGAALDPANDRKHWLARLESADVPHARLHDARDTAASLMIGAGVDIHVVGTVLGHSSTSTTADIYGHVPGRTAGAAIAAAVSLLSR